MLVEKADEECLSRSIAHQRSQLHVEAVKDAEKGFELAEKRGNRALKAEALFRKG